VPRSGLNTQTVVDAAVRLADAEGLDNLTLKRLAAELGVRSPSLFSHVNGLSDLRRQMQLKALGDMAASVGSAAIGRAGDDAVLAAATAMRDFAHAHPGLHAASLRAPPADDRDLIAAADQFINIFFDIMQRYGFQHAEAVHAVRGLFSTIHGFTMLERAGTFGMPIDVDESFRWLVLHYITSLRPVHTAPASVTRQNEPGRRRSNRTGADQ
jgi:AcrR family transcriptional regulator